MQKNNYDSIQQEYLQKAKELQNELIFQGFLGTRIEKGEDRCSFKVIYFDGVRDYLITRDYKNNISVSRLEYARYNNVSSHERAQVYAKYKGQNMKVITPKKLQAKIDAENAIHQELEDLEKRAVDKSNAFIEEMRKLEKQGYDVKFSIQDEMVKGGRVEKNGIIFDFDISQDGYISKRIKIDYKVDSTIESFIKLSDNKFTS